MNDRGRVSARPAPPTSVPIVAAPPPPPPGPRCTQHVPQHPELGPSPEPARWPAEYVGAGRHLALEIGADRDNSPTRYFSRNPSSLHYPLIAHGSWAEWVLLARRILACERERLRQEGGGS